MTDWLSSLRNYQRADAEWLADPAWKHRGRLLASPPGFGKSRSLIAGARLRHETGLARTTGVTIFFTPATARGDIHREAKATWPELPIFTLGITDKKVKLTAEREEKLLRILTACEPTLLISSHESAPKILEAVESRQLLLGTVIVDEAHRLKYSKTNMTKTIHPLIARSERTFLATGTPVHNRGYDLHNLLSLCAPNRFGSRGTFVRRYYSMTVGRYGSTPRELVNKEGLRHDIEGFVMARTVQEAFGELPPRIRKLIEVDVVNDTNIDRTFGGIDRALRFAAKRKLPHVVRLVEELDEPTVVYAYEREHARAIASALNHRGISTTLATGDDPPARRFAKVESEWKSGKTLVLVCTMDALKESATLTRASAMVFADLDWLPGKMVQCEGRIDPARQPEGERRPARYYYVVCSEGADKVTALRVIEKIEEAQGVVSSEAAAVGLKDVLAPMMPKAEWAEDILSDLMARLEAREERMAALL